MDKIKWIKAQLNGDVLFYLFLLVLFFGVATFLLVHYFGIVPCLLGGLWGSLILYYFFRCLRKVSRINKSFHDKFFTSIFTVALQICSLGLVVWGLLLAVWGIQITMGNATIELKVFNNLANGYVHLLEIIGGVVICLLLLLCIQFIRGLLKSEVISDNSDIYGINKEIRDKIKRIRAKHPEQE